MEVKPHIVQVAVFPLEPGHHLSHFGANLALLLLLVDQVYEVLGLIVLLGFLNVRFGCSVVFLKVGINHDAWLPFHIRFHFPLQGDRATNLQVSSDGELVTLLHLEYVLSLCEIGCRAFVVEASCDESAACPSAVPTRNKNEVLAW